MSFPQNIELLGPSVSEGIFHQKFGDMLDFLRLRIWTPSTALVIGCTTQPTVGSRIFMYEALTDGVTGATEPTWPTSEGGTVVDNGITWICKKISGGSGSGGAAKGFGNYIVAPFNVFPGTGLELLIDPNECVIDETLVETVSQTSIALTAKSAQLVYKKKDNTYAKLLPKMSATDLVDANTIGLWFPNGDATVPNVAVGVNGNTLAVSNNLAKTGTITVVDGWAGGDSAKGDGATGYYQSINSTGFPLGTAVRELTYFFTCNSVSESKRMISTGHTNPYWFCLYQVNANIYCTINSSDYDTGFAMEIGKQYLCNLQYDGTNIKLFVNGALIYVLTVSLGTVAQQLHLFTSGQLSTFSSNTAHFVEYRNAIRTPAQISSMAQKLLIPCNFKVNGVTNQVVGSTEGTNFGDMTENGNIAASFDGTTSSVYGSCSAKSSAYAAHIGKRWDYPRVIRKAIVYGPSNAGFTYNNNANVTVSLHGTNDNFATYTTLASSTFYDSATAKVVTLTPTNLSTPFSAHRIWIAQDGSPQALYCAEIIMRYDIIPIDNSDIREALPNKEESKIVSFVVASATGLSIIVGPNNPKGPDPDWAYGMRIGPMGSKNRRKFLGFKYSVVNSSKYWDNPFDSRNIIKEYMFSDDINGKNLISIRGGSTSSGYGIGDDGGISSPIKIIIGGSGIAYSGGWKTYGYIGCYAEVID